MDLKERKIESFSYDNKSVANFIVATIIWGVVGLLVGVLIALQLSSWKFNIGGLEWFSFGRLRPLHTNAIIFAFCGNAIFAGVYYSTQRVLKTRMWNDLLSSLHFWGWQLIIVLAAVTLILGISTGKEYAELEWPIDILITLVWVVFAVNFTGTLFTRREKHIYVSLWFYIATILAIAVLHIVNSLEIPVSFLKSYSLYAGAQDALVQWWYGHNAVAFFLTTPFLGLMYYFIPKASGRPVYSYRLSIIHFWSLVFLYIWSGPHHLFYSSLPEWVQTFGMVFSVMLWAPSWGGMINGLLTLRGVWDRVRTDPVLKFMATAVTFYGMATFEGPLLSIKSINMMSHFTDWTVGHTHSGTVGWNVMLVAGILYYLVPKMWKRELYSVKMANFHFWSTTIGLVLYIVSMWVAGITQGGMWRAVNEAGKLVYPTFIETVIRIVPMYHVRSIGGLFIFVGFVVMAYNLFKTMSLGAAPADEPTEAIPYYNKKEYVKESGHRKLEGLPALFIGFTLIAILVGSIAEIVPTFLASRFVERNPLVKPYSPLQLAGRDIYIREGCYNCHSQWVRPMLDEKLRYGKPMELVEDVYDHPFQWGSKRTGPDLLRIGGKYSNLWHFRHMKNPREVVPQSIMPSYDFMYYAKTDYDVIPKKMKAMKTLGVPYSDEEIKNGVELAKAEALQIINDLKSGGVDEMMMDKEVVSLIAYLQRLGRDMGSQEYTAVEANNH